MENIVYIHYGSKIFDPSIGFPIKNIEHFNKPYEGLWASRKTATFGWREWCEVEEFRDYDKNDCFQFTLKKDSKVATIYCMNDLRQLPTIKSNTSISWGMPNEPYVISPDDYGENDNYTQISLVYYAGDGVLADDEDEVVEDIEDTVGEDFAEHFGEYEDDSVFIRNDRLRCDYEILRDNRSFSDVVEGSNY